MIIPAGRYILSEAALVYYPSALSHIFRGYRGTEAVGEFANASNTLERLQFFIGLFDKYMMGGGLALWLLLICLPIITVGASMTALQWAI